MAQYEEMTVTLHRPADMDGDEEAIVILFDGTRTSLSRDDVSYASWVALCQKGAGEKFSILVRF